MELTGEIAIAAPPKAVWQALNDPHVLQTCIPGCEEVRKISDHETHARVAVKMGPVRARFVGKIFMSDVRPDQGCVLKFEGSGGAAGFAKGQSSVNLEAHGADATVLRYTAQAAIGGKLGQIGGRMIDASAKQMADQFFAALRTSLSANTGPALASNLSSNAPASSTLQPMPTHSTSSPSWVASESVRILWFALGSSATALGTVLAAFVTR